MKEKLTKQYEYKLSKSLGIFVFVLCGVMIWFSLYMALYSYESLDIEGMIELSPQIATYVWWGSSVFFLLLTLLGLLTTIEAFKPPSCIILTDDDITAPKNIITGKTITVKYREVSKLEVNYISMACQIRLHSPKGKIVLVDVNFVNKSEFDELVSILRQKILL